jgi:tRNA (guanosine-2'-O-)-methyltransferase
MSKKQKELLKYFTSFVAPARAELFNRKANERTNYITIVLEDIFQPQNASAVLRSCDCFGIQNVHVIENRNTLTIDKEVAMGASKWLTIHKYNKTTNNSLEAIQTLKKSGYRIVATSPHINDQSLPDFDLTKGKAALIFGSELPGISDIIANEADEFLKIPMYGFTESLNISVSAAIIMFHLTNQLRELNHIDWHLNEQEKDTLVLEWIKKSVKQSQLLEERFFAEKPGKSLT